MATVTIKHKLDELKQDLIFSWYCDQKPWNQYWWAKISLVGLYSLQRTHSLPLAAFDFFKGAQEKSIPLPFEACKHSWLVATSLRFQGQHLSLLRFSRGLLFRVCQIILVSPARLPVMVFRAYLDNADNCFISKFLVY